MGLANYDYNKGKGSVDNITHYLEDVTCAPTFTGTSAQKTVRRTVTYGIFGMTAHKLKQARLIVESANDDSKINTKKKYDKYVNNHITLVGTGRFNKWELALDLMKHVKKLVQNGYSNNNRPNTANSSAAVPVISIELAKEAAATFDSFSCTVRTHNTEQQPKHRDHGGIDGTTSVIDATKCTLYALWNGQEGKSVRLSKPFTSHQKNSS